MNGQISVGHEKFLEAAKITDFKVCHFDIPTKLTVWQTFTMMSDVPFATVNETDVPAFLTAWSRAMDHLGVKENETIYVSVGGDPFDGNWLELRAGQLTSAWRSGVQKRFELECAILSLGKSEVVGMTFEENSDYNFFLGRV